MKIILTLIILCIGFAFSAFGQYSVRDEFPNGKERGNQYQYFTKDQWEASNYASDEALNAWEDLRYGMFIHFGITAMAEKDLSWGSISLRYAPDTPSTMANGKERKEDWTNWYKGMKLENFNATEWVKIAKRAGFKYIVITTKHHEGFHMWNTKFSDFKITNTPFGRDYTKELVDACHAAKMPIGFYFSQRDWYHPDYQPVDTNKVLLNGVHWKLKPGETSPLGPLHYRYLKYLRNVVRELCTKYGKIDIWWWDAVSHGGMFTSKMWDSENLNRMIRKLQPGIVIDNRASIPGDFDTPEGHLGAFQDWRPWESCIPLSDAWCYTGKPPHSYDHVLHLIAGAACGNGNLLLSWGPHWDGAFDEAQIQRLYEVGDWLKVNGKSIYGTRGGPWKPTGWGGSTHKGNIVYIHVFKQLDGGKLSLPSISNRLVLAARMLGAGDAVKFEQDESHIELFLSKYGAIKGDMVIELIMNKTMDRLPAVISETAVIF